MGYSPGSHEELDMTGPLTLGILTSKECGFPGKVRFIWSLTHNALSCVCVCVCVCARARVCAVSCVGPCRCSGCEAFPRSHFLWAVPTEVTGYPQRNLTRGSFYTSHTFAKELIYTT